MEKTWTSVYLIQVIMRKVKREIKLSADALVNGRVKVPNIDSIFEQRRLGLNRRVLLTLTFGVK